MSGASFTDIVNGITSDLYSLVTGTPLAGPPLQKEIDAVTIQLRAANQAGDFVLAQKLLQEIKGLQARAAGMPNPVIGRLETIQNVDAALDSSPGKVVSGLGAIASNIGGAIASTAKSAGDAIGGIGSKALIGGVAVLLLYVYVNKK